MTQDEIIEALEENKQQAQEAINQKVVQIVMNGDFPDITYNNMSIAEVLGALRLAQELVFSRQIRTPMLKYQLGQVVESL